MSTGTFFNIIRMSTLVLNAICYCDYMNLKKKNSFYLTQSHQRIFRMSATLLRSGRGRTCTAGLEILWIKSRIILSRLKTTAVKHVSTFLSDVCNFYFCLMRPVHWNKKRLSIFRNSCKYFVLFYLLKLNEPFNTVLNDVLTATIILF